MRSWEKMRVHPRTKLAPIVAALAFLAVSCTSAAPPTVDDGVGADDDPDAVEVRISAPGRVYVAQWLVDAEAANREGPGFPFTYREVVDEREGVYLVQSPDHLALQTRPSVVFCAGIFRSRGVCASSPRPDGVPDILAIGPTRLKEWSPESIFEVADPRTIGTVAEAEPDAWTTRSLVIAGVATDCFVVVGDTSAAPEGFEVCFTADDNRLIASLDLEGDFILEVELREYRTNVTEADTVVPFDLIESDALYENLVLLFPELPPEPTPEPE